MQNRSMMLAGGVAVAVIAVAAVMLRGAATPPPVVLDSAAEPAALAAAEPAAVEAAEPEALAAAEPAVVEAAEPEALAAAEPAAVEAAEPEAVQQAAPAQDEVQDPIVTAMAPQITDFRFEPDGGLLVSGRATSGNVVAVLVDGAEVERVNAASDGRFVVVGFLGYSPTPRRMSLVADPDGLALAADRTYVLEANPEPAAPSAGVAQAAGLESAPAEPLVEAHDSGAAPAAAVVAEQTPRQAGPETPLVAAAEDPPEPATDVEPVADPADAATAQPATPTILALDRDGVRVVQAPVAPDAPPEVMASVALDSISYDVDGDVVLAGRAPNQNFVQVYVNNAPVSRPFVDKDGRWRTDLPDVDKGVYTLRIDEVDSAGAVVSRIETPFQRADPEDVTAAMATETADPSFTIATRTVQPGATLWAIAEERYGSGVQYVTVFEANRDRIRDPDLIYPGQVFVIPETGN